MTPIEKLAWEHAFDQYLSEPVEAQKGLDLMDEWEKTGETPEGLVIWEPFENHSFDTFFDLVDSVRASFMRFYREAQNLESSVV